MGDRLATIDMGRKLKGLCPFGEGGPGSPSNTVWPGLRPTCTPSFILLRPTVWPQCTNVTDRTDRQTDNGPIDKANWERHVANGLRSAYYISLASTIEAVHWATIPLTCTNKLTLSGLRSAHGHVLCPCD